MTEDDKVIMLIADTMLRAYGEEKKIPLELAVERLRFCFWDRPELVAAVEAIKKLFAVAIHMKVPPGLEPNEWRKASH